MKKEIENYKKELMVKDYCHKYKISEQQLFEELSISSYDELQNWTYVLIVLSTVKYNKDFLTKFMNNERYLELKKRNFNNTELGSKLPDELKSFFSIYGDTCPDCGGLITEYNASYIVGIPLDSYKCINCDNTYGGLEQVMDKIHGFDRRKEEADKNKWLDKYIEQAVIIDRMLNSKR